MTIVVLTGLLMAVGLVGIVVPVLPGLILVSRGPLVVGRAPPRHRAWYVFAVAAVIYAAGLTTQYLIPGRRLRSAGVSTWTLVLAVILGIVGFFVIPVVGALSASSSASSWSSWAPTPRRWSGLERRPSMRSSRWALSMGIELVTGLLIAWSGRRVFALGVG